MEMSEMSQIDGQTLLTAWRAIRETLWAIARPRAQSMFQSGSLKQIHHMYRGGVRCEQCSTDYSV